MKRLIAIALCLATLCLAGCKKAPAPAPAEEPLDDISGTWLVETNYGGIVKEQVAKTAEAELGAFLEQELGDFKVQIRYTFNADGTYKRERLEESSKEDMAAFEKSLKQAYDLYFQSLPADVRAELSPNVFDNKVQYIIKTTLPLIFEKINMAGQYKVVKGGKIQFSTLPDSSPDGNNYWSYKLEGDTLTIQSVTATAGEETLAYPLVFKKSK